MQTLNSHSKIASVLIFAATLGVPLMLGGCVVEPNPYYAAAPAPAAVYSAPAPYYYAEPAYYVGPSVYIGGGCCYGGWRRGGWHR